MNRRDAIKSLGAMLFIPNFDLNTINQSLISLLERGAENNIIVYDSDAIEGVFTLRLLSVMKTVFTRFWDESHNSKLKTIYLPSHTNGGKWGTNHPMYINKPCKLFGVDVKIQDGLTEYLLKDKTNQLAENDKFVVLGVGTAAGKDEPLLGSF